MASVTKYMFDRSFDDKPKKKAAAAAPPPVAEEPPPPPEPTFSQADLDAARTQGMADGREEALRESAQAVAQRIDQTLAALGERLDALFAARDAADRRAEEQAVAVAVGIARKVLPAMNARNALDEVERLARSVLDHIAEAETVRVEVHADLADEVGRRIDALAAARGHMGRVTMIGTPDLAPGDCRIDWGDGGAERDVAALWRRIDEILERNLGLTPPDTEPAAEAAPDTDDSDDTPGGDGPPSSEPEPRTE
ncbi:MAG: hypothetical protein H6907_12840 [Hyphomicrobiales bacterium]|nr:hypothetical protein [Hyphomicrobiales bacterium]